MEIIVFLSIVTAVSAVLISVAHNRRVKSKSQKWSMRWRM